MINLQDISLTFFDTKATVLKDINWHIKDGENWVLFGRNGSGKTKLLEIITGYMRPTSGEVFRFGNSPLGFDLRETRKQIGYMSSVLKGMIHRNEKIIDVVISGLYAATVIYHQPDDEETTYGYELLETIGMENRADELFSHLSDGEKQKVLMLRAFINKPKLLILDEPCTGLDVAAVDDFLTALKKLAGSQTTSIVYVTHHIEEITDIFSKIFIIQKGECFFKGNISDGINSTVLQKVFNRPLEVLTIKGKYHTIL